MPRGRKLILRYRNQEIFHENGEFVSYFHKRPETVLSKSEVNSLIWTYAGGDQVKYEKVKKRMP